MKTFEASSNKTVPEETDRLAVLTFFENGITTETSSTFLYISRKVYIQRFYFFILI